MTITQIEETVLAAIRNANLARTPDAQLTAAPDAPLFGAGSPLDSLGLVALIIDIEEAFAAAGVTVALSDDRAMSQRYSPFRTVASLVDYIGAQRHGPA
jgi:acyl carrier protein